MHKNIYIYLFSMYTYVYIYLEEFNNIENLIIFTNIILLYYILRMYLSDFHDVCHILYYLIDNIVIISIFLSHFLHQILLCKKRGRRV